MVHITALLAGLLALLFVQLSMHVMRLRKMHQISSGSGGVDELDLAIRRQTNFADHVPLGLVLMGALELNGAPWILVSVLGTILLTGCYFNAHGLGDTLSGAQSVAVGSKWTFLALALMSLANIGWTAYQFIELARFAGSLFLH